MGRAATYVALVFWVLFSCGCSISRTVQPVEINAELADFLSHTDLIYANDMYWVKDPPQPDSSLGSVYEKIVIEIKNAPQTFTAFKFAQGGIFNTLGGTNIKKDAVQFSNAYSYNAGDGAGLVVMSAFTGTASNVYQMDKKVEIHEIWQPNIESAIFGRKYCNDKYYYVTRAWVGDSADMGAQAAQYLIKVVGFSVSTQLTKTEKTSLHPVKHGILAYSLEPVNNLGGCQTSSLMGRFMPLPINTIGDELRKKGFKQVSAQ